MATKRPVCSAEHCRRFSRLKEEDGRLWCWQHAPSFAAGAQRVREMGQQIRQQQQAEREVLAAAVAFDTMDAEAANQNWTIAPHMGRWGEARRRLQAAVAKLREARAG